MSGTATPLLVHGSVGDSTVWRRVQDALRPAAALAIDLPGFGAAAGVRLLGTGTVESYVGTLAAAARAVGGPVVAVGNGIGAVLCAHLALRKDASVRAVLMVGPVGLPDGHARWGRLSRSAAGAAILRVAGRTFARERFLRDQLADPDADPEAAEILLDALGRARGFPRLARLNRPESLDGLDAIRCPVEVLWGERDGVLPVTQAPRLLERLPAHTRFEAVRGAGHALPLERADLVAARIRRACAYPESVEGAPAVR